MKAWTKGIVSALRQDETENNDGMDICMIKLEKAGNSQHKLTFSGASRPLYYCLGGDNKLNILKGDRRSIGGVRTKRKTAIYFTNQELMLPVGSMAFLSTDGYTDQNDTERNKLGVHEFNNLLHKALSINNINQQKDILDHALDQHMGIEKQRDDITVIGIKV
ncbi:MAG: SpoIIE family protein phosphatase [Bacteroidales bacterium]|nr:SpoIIE family protein phosphatase [Bacteroidales bacterium]